MCIIIDTCTFSKVFNTTNKEHSRFVPVYDWIYKKRAKIIIGGTKYLGEMRHALKLLTEFEKKRQIIRLDTTIVDDTSCEVKQKEPSKKFNDEHLVAIIIVSGCRVICTDDTEAIPYLKRKDLYPQEAKPPSIYNRARHSKLCCDDNVVGICRDDANKKAVR
jgi:hypothetical protein